MIASRLALVAYGKLRKTMFCPLCKAEYRPGFTTCSDCQVALVATEQAARDTKVENLWVGEDAQVLDGLLNSLADAGIPFRSRELVRSNARPWISILFWQFRKPKPVSEYRVDIFEKDADRARPILERIATVESLD